jgi:polysaccharide pyruvyl transferase WcaK-like protein
MNKCSPKVFLLGYGGANNTGAEIRILTIIDDFRAAFGAGVQITVGSVNPEKTKRVLGYVENVEVVRVPYVFPWAIWKLTRANDMVVLVEGSTFKDNWSSALLYLFLWGAWSAKRHGNLSVAYAVDAGRMSRFNRWLTRRVCEGMDLVITRTAAARDQLRALGVRRDIAVTTDTAFQFGEPLPSTSAQSVVVGLAPVEFYQWPVRFQLWGAKENCYHWPYYFSWSRRRRRKSEALVDAWVALVAHIVEKKGWDVRFFAMEELDGEICRKIMDRLPEPVRERVTTCFAGEQTPQAVVSELRKLDYLVTSRYHACVLSMANAVPQMALYHDERLVSIYEEIGISEYAVRYSSGDLDVCLVEGFERLLDGAEQVRACLSDRLARYFMPRCLENRELLRRWHDGLFFAEEK